MIAAVAGGGNGGTGRGIEKPGTTGDAVEAYICRDS